MPRVFGHYGPAPLVALAPGEAAVVFGSVFLGLALPLVGFPAIRPAWGDAFAPAAILAALVPAMALIAGLYDTRQVYGRLELLLRLTTAFISAYLTIAILGYLTPALTLARKAFLLSFMTAFPTSFLLRRVEVEDWPTFYEKLTGKIPVGNLRPSWLVFADGFKPARLTRLTKRTIDLLVSVSLVALSLPLLLAIAVAIRLDSTGPVFFRQERIGRFGRIFRIFKFRSMRSGSHPVPPPGEPDPRVTRVGRFLRRTRLDELPQLFNVIAGDMSLVGPRPEWVALVPEFREKVPLYVHRLAAKPGITGWAQVKNPYSFTVGSTWEKLPVR